MQLEFSLTIFKMESVSNCFYKKLQPSCHVIWFNRYDLSSLIKIKKDDLS